ncbi:MAG: POTRA domain-containing protein, partial [Rhodoferax sp.]
MKALLAGLMVAIAPGLLLAQDLSANPAQTAATAATASVAFELHIEAPDEIRTLLANHLELLRYRALTDLSDSELARLLTTAEQETRELVGTLGYFTPSIRFDQAAPRDSATTRKVTLTVVPGEPTLVADVQVQFSGPILAESAAAPQRQQIEDDWSLQAGMRFTQARWDSAKQQALRELTAQRYPTGQLASTLADIDPVTRLAHLAVTVNSGPAYRLGGLVIEGLKRYDEELVTRLARLTPGAIYDQSEMVNAQQRLTDSGYFDSAFVSLDTAGDPTAAPVRVQLREARLKKLVLGLGASTDGGARLSAEHTHHKVPGIGWRAVSKLMLDRESRTLGSELTSPPDADNWRWITSAQFQNQALGSFDVNSQTVRVGRGQIGDRIDRNYYLQYERADTATSDPAKPSIAQALSANYAWTLRNFNSAVFPTKGWG